MSRELMQQALEALEFEASGWEDVPPITREAITALRQALSEQPAHQEVDWEKLYWLEVKKKEALAAKYERDTGKKLTRIVPMAEPALRQALEAEQEPVAWLKTWSDGSLTVLKSKSGAFADHELEPLYTAPPNKEWVGLTADEIWKCNKAKSGSAVEFHICSAHQNVLDFAESIEARLKEKNHG